MNTLNKESTSIPIDDYFLNNYIDAKNYKWKCLSHSKQKKNNKNGKCETLVFSGKKNKNEIIFVKQIKFPSNKNKQILKKFIFLFY